MFVEEFGFFFGYFGNLAGRQSDLLRSELGKLATVTDSESREVGQVHNLMSVFGR